MCKDSSHSPAPSPSPLPVTYFVVFDFRDYCPKWPAALAAPRRAANDEPYWTLRVPADFGAPTK